MQTPLNTQFARTPYGLASTPDARVHAPADRVDELGAGAPTRQRDRRGTPVPPMAALGSRIDGNVGARGESL